MATLNIGRLEHPQVPGELALFSADSCIIDGAPTENKAFVNLQILLLKEQPRRR